MLIAAKHKRPNAPITLGGKDGTERTTYFFKPIDPADANSEHVADVTIPEHVQRLLGIPEGYYIAAAQSLTTVAKPTAPVSSATDTSDSESSKSTDDSSGGDPTSTSTSDGTGNSDEPTDAQLEAANTLLALSWQKLKVTVAGADPAVLRLALSIEQAKGDLAQETKIKILTTELGG